MKRATHRIEGDRVRFMVSGIGPQTRRMYRILRKDFKLSRHDANLIVFGVAMTLDTIDMVNRVDGR